MTREEFSAIYQKHHEEEFLKFEKIKYKRTTRPDLHAFLLLDELCPSKSDILACAHHDEVCLEPELDKLAKVINEEQIIELIRCGILVDGDGLCMFV